MRKSPGAIVFLIRASTLATYSFVSSIREPVGAFRLMVNWPASERGKNESPRNGTSPKLSDEQPHESDHGQQRAIRGSSHQSFIHIEQPIEAAVECGIEARSPGKLTPAFRRAGRMLAMPMRDRLEKARAEQRNDRHRHDERNHQRNTERERQGGKQELTHAKKQRDREKIDNSHQSARQYGERNFRRPRLSRHRRQPRPFPDGDRCSRWK